VHAKKIKLSPDVNLRTVARGTPGFSGADLANLVNEAALLSARKGKRLVTPPEFEESRDKVKFGAEKRSMVQTEDEKKLTAYHEGGHALVSLNVESCDPIHKATILPRGRALGMVMSLPEKDSYSQTREFLKGQIAMAMGGRVAEEIIFGHDKVTSGAMSDIKAVTSIAKHMVTEAGMSELLGPLTYGDNQDEVFLGRSVARNQQMSEETQKKVDSEVKKLVDEGYQKATKILKENIESLHKLAKNLLLYETLTGDEIRDLILRNKPISRKDEDDLEKNDKGSALGSMGLKPKIVH
jgi:cell division protease FtsH